MVLNVTFKLSLVKILILTLTPLHTTEAKFYIHAHCWVHENSQETKIWPLILNAALFKED